MMRVLHLNLRTFAFRVARFIESLIEQGEPSPSIIQEHTNQSEITVNICQHNLSCHAYRTILVDS